MNNTYIRIGVLIVGLNMFISDHSVVQMLGAGLIGLWHGMMEEAD